MTVKAGARAAACATATLVFVSAGTPAGAHPEFSALGTNRYVTAAVLDGRIDVTDALLEGLLPAGDDRQRFDADGDGRISAAELASAGERLRAEAPAVIVTVDERVLSAPLEVSIDLGEQVTTADAPVVIERRQSFEGALPTGVHRLRVVVTREPTRLLETELGVVLGPGLSLRQGPDRVRLSGARVSTLEERAATFIVERSPPAPPARRARPAFLVLALATFVATIAAAAFRRRARRSAP